MKPTSLLHVHFPQIPRAIGLVTNSCLCDGSHQHQVLQGLDELGGFKTGGGYLFPSRMNYMLAEQSFDFCKLRLNPADFDLEALCGSEISAFHVPLDPFYDEHQLGHFGQDFSHMSSVFTQYDTKVPHMPSHDDLNEVQASVALARKHVLDHPGLAAARNVYHTYYHELQGDKNLVSKQTSIPKQDSVSTVGLPVELKDSATPCVAIDGEYSSMLSRPMAVHPAQPMLLSPGGDRPTSRGSYRMSHPSDSKLFRSEAHEHCTWGSNIANIAQQR